MTQLVSRSGYHLDWIKVQLTRLCNFTCEFCSQADWASLETLDLDTFKTSVFDRLDYLRLLIITGGEPLARYSELQDLVDMAKAKGCEVGIFSNLSLLSEKKAEDLANRGVNWVRTTMNGSTAVIHEKTYPKKSFDKTMKGIEAAKKYGIPVKIRSTVCQANVNDLPDLIQTAYDLGIREVDFRPYLPLGDCNPHNSYALGVDQVLDAAAQILALKTKWNFKVQLKLLPNWFDFLYRDLIEGDTLKNCELCNCGRKYLYVDAVGSYRSCAGHRNVVTNIFEKNIDDIWDSGEFLELSREYEQDPYCHTCPRRKQCMGSNCHLVNYEVHGRFDKVNPTCPIYNVSPTDPVVGYDIIREKFKTSYAKYISGEVINQQTNTNFYNAIPVREL